ncbi:hypothetical protein CI102_13337 [Trichoderma harzianum]|nr:hypothetical protein CI102_13337 [Trichoderma harzianum]
MSHLALFKFLILFTAANKYLLDGSYSEEVKAGLLPIWREQDFAPIAITLGLIGNIETAKEHYHIFCDEDHLQWNDARNAWLDTAFTYTYTDDDGSTKDYPISISRGYDPKLNKNTKPFDLGRSWVLAGKKGQLNGREIDFSDQYHVHMNPKIFSNADPRSIQTIVADGFQAGFDALDKIQPPSMVILHELSHLVRGLDENGNLIITDGPAQRQYYGYAAAVQAKVDAGNGGGAPNLIANSIEYGTKIMALVEVMGSSVWWSTGRIDLNTYEAIARD